MCRSVGSGVDLLRLAQRMDNTRYIYDSVREVRAAIDAARFPKESVLITSKDGKAYPIAYIAIHTEDLRFQDLD